MQVHITINPYQYKIKATLDAKAWRYLEHCANAQRRPLLTIVAALFNHGLRALRPPPEEPTTPPETPTLPAPPPQTHHTPDAALRVAITGMAGFLQCATENAEWQNLILEILTNDIIGLARDEEAFCPWTWDYAKNFRP